MILHDLKYIIVDYVIICLIVLCYIIVYYIIAYYMISYIISGVRRRLRCGGALAGARGAGRPRRE